MYLFEFTFVGFKPENIKESINANLRFYMFYKIPENNKQMIKTENRNYKLINPGRTNSFFQTRRFSWEVKYNVKRNRMWNNFKLLQL